MANLETRKLLAVAADAADSKKAEEIRILELDPTESALTDYFLICSGTNDRQNVAIADEIEHRLKKEFGNTPNSIEGRRQGEWILMDYVDFIVHVMLPDRREYYGLERLKKSATRLSLDDLKTSLRGKVKEMRAKTPAKKSASKKTATKKTAAKKAVKKAVKKTPVKAKVATTKRTVKKATKKAAK